MLSVSLIQKVSLFQFNQRGEYQGGPDGCAFDFETSAEAFQVVGNMFYRSWGAASIDTLSI